MKPSADRKVLPADAEREVENLARPDRTPLRALVATLDPDSGHLFARRVAAIRRGSLLRSLLDARLRS